MDESLRSLLQAIEASLTRIADLLEVITDALVDPDPDAEEARMSLDGPVANAPRDPAQPL